MFGVSKRLSRSISLAVYRLYIFFFWLIGSLVDSTLAAFVVCGPLQFLVSQKKRLFLISAKLRKENKKNATAGGEQVDYLPAWPSQLTDRV